MCLCMSFACPVVGLSIVFHIFCIMLLLRAKNLTNSFNFCNRFHKLEFLNSSNELESNYYRKVRVINYLKFLNSIKNFQFRSHFIYFSLILMSFQASDLGVEVPIFTIFYFSCLSLIF